MGFSVLLSSVVCINFKFSISFPVLSRERNGHYKQDQKRKKKRLRIKAMMNNLPGAWVAESAAVSRETFEFHHKRETGGSDLKKLEKIITLVNIGLGN